MKKTIFMAGVLAMMTLGFNSNDVEASSKDPSLNLSSKYNSTDESVTISLESTGVIELPDGKKVTSPAKYTVKDNGVYSFTADLDGVKVNKSISVVLIQPPILKTKTKDVKLEAIFQDNDSGIEKVRFRNDVGDWSGWKSLPNVSKKGTISFDWSLNPVEGDGLYNVFAQFMDKAGNMTEGTAYTRVSYSTNGNFVDTAPTLSLSAIEDKVNNVVNIKIESNASVLTPFGTFVKDGALFQVKSNGVYSFTAYLNGMELNQSISIGGVKTDMLRTKKKEVSVITTLKDNHSGVDSVRFKNKESDSWSPWKPTKEVHNDGTDKFDWDLDDNEDGEKTVYAQFKDRADNVTQGAALDKIILDSTAPDFSIVKGKYYYKNNKIFFSLSDVKDKLSKEKDVFVSFDGITYQQVIRPENTWTDLEAVIPDEMLFPGEKIVFVKVNDSVGNMSESKSFKIFFDDVLPTGNVAITKRNGSELGLSKYTDPKTGIEEDVVLTDTGEVGLSIDVNDLDSGMTRQNGGVAKVIIKEMIGGKWLKDREISIIPPSGKLQIDWTLDYGLEKQIEMTVVDNAGNEKKVLSETIRMSNLQLEYFRIQNTVNPDGGTWIPIDITTSSPQAKLFSGTNVTFKIGYNLINSDKKDAIFTGKLNVKINKPATNGNKEYDKIISINLNNPYAPNLSKDDLVPYFMDLFTIPKDAPEGATVSIQGNLDATFSDKNKLSISFPRKNENIYQEIGTIVDNIQNRIEFNQIK